MENTTVLVGDCSDRSYGSGYGSGDGYSGGSGYGDGFGTVGGSNRKKP